MTLVGKGGFTPLVEGSFGGVEVCGRARAEIVVANARRRVRKSIFVVVLVWGRVEWCCVVSARRPNEGRYSWIRSFSYVGNGTNGRLFVICNWYNLRLKQSCVFDLSGKNTRAVASQFNSPP